MFSLKTATKLTMLFHHNSKTMFNFVQENQHKFRLFSTIYLSLIFFYIFAIDTHFLIFNDNNIELRFRIDNSDLFLSLFRHKRITTNTPKQKCEVNEL